ncbi:MAG TPA: NAD-dependent epimerase/dehydratase family protein [Gemmatimonadales bacterium]
MTAAPWLVTGASGFLGRHLLEQIGTHAPDRRVVALVRSPAEWEEMAWTRPLTKVDVLSGGVTAPERWASAGQLAGLGGIFHLAALVRHGRRDAEEVYFTNVEGTRAMVRVAAQYRCRLVFVSTSGTVGCFRKPGETADEDAPWCESEVKAWPYYHSKVLAEREGQALAKELGVELVIVRPPVLLGPGDHRLRSTNHVSRFLLGKVPFLIRGGMHFADVRDAAAALLHAMERTPARPVYHLPGTICTLQEFYGMVARASGKRPPRLILPYLPALLAARISGRLGLHLLPEPALVEMAAHYWGTRSRYAEAELGYRSRPGEVTIRETVEWLAGHHPELGA